jgi:hypothetical protein
MPAPSVAAALFTLAAAAVVGLGVHWGWRQRARRAFIRSYRFQPDVLAALDEVCPGLSAPQRERVAQALRSYFLVHAQAPRAVAGMPSKAVDALWHAFILDTRAYHAFCQRAFGGYFHHLPASRMRPGMGRELGLRLTWRLACQQEGIDPAQPTRLPLLFRIDAAVGWPGGNTFTLERMRQPPATDPSSGGSSSSCSGGCGGYACSGDGLVGDGSGGDGGCSGGCGGD